MCDDQPRTMMAASSARLAQPHLAIALLRWVRTVPKPMPSTRRYPGRYSRALRAPRLRFPARSMPDAAATQQRATQIRFERIEKPGIAVAEIGTPAAAPDAKIAEIAFAVEHEHVDTMMESVAGQKIIVELAALHPSRAE